MSGGNRRCRDCGAMNLDDATFCAECGVELSLDHLPHAGLAALVDDDDAPPATSTPAAPTGAGPGTEPGATVPRPTPPSGAVPPGPAGADPTVVGAAMPPTVATPPPAAPVAVPSSPERPWILPTLVVFVVLAVAAAVLVVLGTRSGDDSTAPVNDPVATDPSGTQVPVSTDAPGTAPPETTPSTDTTAPPSDTTDPPTDTTAPATTAPSVDPAIELATLAAADLPRALDLRERWVPQLSAKQDGTVWEGVTYDLAGILSLHGELSDRVGSTLLVEGSNLAFFIDGERMTGWWFTFADVDFDDADQALAWCEDAGFDRSNCAARLLTDRDDATGTLRLRPA